MPLKHSTETAYILLLALVICVAGFLTSLLPPYPTGMPYWAILLTIFVLYPLIFTPTFRNNRADYEFRMLHWFPAAILLLWLALQFLAPKFKIMHILHLGFLFLWSLPLVALGIVFIIIFAFHVIRRRTFRVTVLLLLLTLFIAGAVSAEGLGWNNRLQAAIFPKELPTIDAVRNVYATIVNAYATVVRTVRGAVTSSGTLIAQNGRSSSAPFSVAAVTSSARSSVTMTTTSSSSRSSSASSRLSSARSSVTSAPASFAMSSVSSSAMPPVIGTIKPDNLASSGPEDIALLSVTMGALYFGLLHRRAQKR